MNYNEAVNHTVFTNPTNSDFVICSNPLCRHPKKYITGNDSFLCHGIEDKGSSGVTPDRCMRHFIVVKEL